MSESPQSQSAVTTSRWSRRLGRLPLLARWWWGTGLGLFLSVVVLTSLEIASCINALLVALLILWSLPSSVVVMLWLWRKLTYRISVRLFISYLLIGVLPFPLLLVLGGLAGYVLVGQYASSEFGDVSERVRLGLLGLVEETLNAADTAGGEAAADRLRRGPRLAADLEAVVPHVEWLWAADEGSADEGSVDERSADERSADESSADERSADESSAVLRSDGAAGLAVPKWAEEGAASGVFKTGDGMLMAAVARRNDRLAAAVLRLRPETARMFSAGHWYEVSFLDEAVTLDERANVTITSDDDYDDGNDDGGEEGEDEEVQEAPGGQVPDSRQEPGRDDTVAGSGTGDEAAEAEPETTTGVSQDQSWLDRLWHNRWIFFMRLSPELRRWEDGSAMPDRAAATILRTSPREAAADLFRSPYDIDRILWQVFYGTSWFFFWGYVAVVAVAVVQIFSVTRSTARLTRGTRQVEAGRLDYRIPVRRRDQLGDLAVSFNRMTASVESMLEAVAEKERLKGELELAREIQESLLPGRQLRHGSLSVHAFFRPAAEVGGDYFDLFPLEPGRLIVATGDVAGHGLPTGLLMAMVKSAVATLVQEGHRGVELLERVNDFMLKQPRGHRMLTLAIADIDSEAGVAEITNAAHPPVFLSGGTVEEVMLPALPVGYPWRRPPPSKRLDFPPGSRLVFYSDGLVEAVDPDEEPFGYERLRRFLEEHAELGPEELLAVLLAELERHTGGRAMDDDLTILILDR